MARIRSIKPEFFTSESVGALSWGARLTFSGLWTQVDDQGRAKDNPKVFRGALWPNDEETVSSADVARFIDEMVANGMVCRYVVDGTSYLHVIKMRKHQSINKPTASKLPECPAHANGGSPTPPGDLPEASGAIQDESGDPPEDSGSTTGDLPEDYRGERKGKERKGTGKGREEPPSSSETASPPPDPDPEPAREDVSRICLHLAERIEGNGSKRPPITKGWRDAARLMLDRDGRTEDDVHAAIDWSQNHSFWRGNILSLPKLREKFDQLRLQAERERRAPPPHAKGSNDQYLAAEMEWALQAEAEEAARRHSDTFEEIST